MSKRNVFPSFAEEVRQKQLAARHAEMDAFAAVPAASDKAEDGVTHGAAAQMKRLSSAAADAPLSPRCRRYPRPPCGDAREFYRARAERGRPYARESGGLGAA